jgi:two-component system sensor histidine kinase PilS (NtrC family)
VEITGRPLAELLGQDFGGLLQQDRGFLERLRAGLDRDSRCRFELDHEDARGRQLFLGFTVSPLRNRAGENLGLIFIFQDLTEIRALEEEVALKKRMAALGEMAAGVAHELRNPLASISGSVQVLKRDLDPPGEAGSLMEIVVKESRRLDQIVRDFLLFAKPGRFHAEPVDLVGLIRDSLALLENSEERRPHHAVELAPGPERVVARLDANRMKQVFWNLARNALKAMPGGGTLAVRVREAPGEVVVSFADTGIGMPDRDIASNFQPFHGSFPQGTGLGLSIVYRIVEEHGGRIRVKSRPGEGTEIALHLPQQAGVAAEEAAWTGS